jgi:hypothetical protein
MDVALVDLDYVELDQFRAVLADRLEAEGEDPGEARRARVRLVLADAPVAPALAWAGLAGVPCAGESGRLGEVVVDCVIVSPHSPRRDAVARLAAALAVRVLVLPAAANAATACEGRP